MFKALSQVVYCLWCLPAIITFLVGLFLWKKASRETHFNPAPVGVNLLGAEGQKIFETGRERDRRKKKILVWCIAGGVAAYVIALIVTSLPVGAKTADKTPTPTITETAAVTLTPQPSGTLSMTATPDFTATYAPTATARIIYQNVNVPGPVQVVTVIVPQQVPVVITQVVTVVVTQVVTATFTPTPTSTPTPTWTPTATETP